MDIFEQSPFKEENEAFLRVLDVANVNALSEEERAIYDENLKNYRDWYNTIEYAADDGMKKGLEQGLERGLEQGIHLAARRMKESGMSPSEIAAILDLPIEDIETL